MFNRYNFSTGILLLVWCLVNFGKADCSFKIVVKYPFSSGYFDTLGNWVSDSLVRYREIKATIYRSELIESLSQECMTDNEGEAVFMFSKWRDGTSIDITNIQRMDIEFPNSYEVIRVGEEVSFKPLKFESIGFKGDEAISIVLPMTVYMRVDTIGAGPFTYAFAIMPDMHIAEGKKKQRHIVDTMIFWLSDFGTPGFDDADNDPNETTFAIENNRNIVAMINQLASLYDLKFVVCLGDITSTSERSEYERAKRILANLDLPWIPILGNHDT